MNISGRSFSEHCKWVVDNRYPDRNRFNYNESVSGDWVFINGDFLSAFARSLQMVPLKRLVCIVHNSDQSFTEHELTMIDRHALKIYTINTTISHPKLITIPIGFPDRHLAFLREWQPVHQERDIEVYCNFMIATNMRKRNECVRAVANDTRVVMRYNLSVPEYYADLSRSKYVLCPEGTGIDTHRVYESMMCGATPVVLRNSLSHLYEKLPVCIVDSWTDTFYVPTERNCHLHTIDYLTMQQ